MSDQPDLFDALKSEVIEGAPLARPTRTSSPTSAQSRAKGRQPKLGAAEGSLANCDADRLRTQPAVVPVVPFPLVARVGKIRDVAAKMVATKSPRHAESYRAQVTEALRVNLASKRVPASLHASELRQFWQAVDLEVARLLNPNRRPGGGTA